MTTRELLIEAANRLETSNSREWIGKPYATAFCTICQDDEPNHKPDCLISRLRAASQQEMRIPEGYALVPISATSEMIAAAIRVTDTLPSLADRLTGDNAITLIQPCTHHLAGTIAAELARDYRAMIAASPQGETT